MKNTCLLTPFYGKGDFDHLECRAALQKEAAHMCCRNVAYIGMARSKLATEAMRQCPENYDVFLWLDHDILFNPDDARALVQRLRDSTYDVLGVCYPFRSPGAGIIGMPDDDIDEVEYYADGPDIVPAKFLGMGFTAVRRSVFDRLAPLWPTVYAPVFESRIHPFFAELVTAERWEQEDLSFCQRVKDAGMKIGIYTKPRIVHRGEYDYTLEDGVFERRLWGGLRVTYHEKAAE